MKKSFPFKSFVVLCSVFVLLIPAIAQKRTVIKPSTTSKSIIFAVINDGKQLEPIATIEKGKLVQTTAGDSDEKDLISFSNTYYKPKTTYKLIFGGIPDGTTTVNGSNPKAECGKNLADISMQSVKGKIKGLVMGLATNEVFSKNESGVRRFPTPAERVEIESLVRAEFAKQKLSENSLKNLHYHNLTALDANNDKKAELVGSFWVENSAKERNLLFFIAEKGNDGKYFFNHSEYKKITAEEVMSGELKPLDNGIYNELLIDVFDIDNNGSAEIFTINQGFEGNSFNVYSRQNGKWTNIFESSNYHCAY